MEQAKAGAGAAGGTPADGAGHPGLQPTDVPDPPARRPGPSVRPALIVVGIALFLILLFGIGAALTSNPASKPPAPSHLKGSSLVAVASSVPLRPIEILGTPPADILDALVLPKGAQKVSVTKWSGSTQFDGKMSFRIGVSQGSLVAFFHTELRTRGWSILSVGAAHGHPGATEVLAQRASTDGWFWEAGFVVFPTAFGHGSAHTEMTRFSLDLYEMPDAT